MFRRIWLVAALFIVLSAVWYWPLISQLLKPGLVQIGAIKVEQPEQNGFIYERLGISSPLSVNSQTSPITEQDWSKISKDLRQGVSLAFEADSFKDAQLAFLTGHSSDTIRQPYASIFAPLGQAKIGDSFKVVVDDESYNYEVIDKIVISPAAVDQFRQLEDDNIQRVALVTCWPPLTTANRMVVVGNLVK